MERWTQSKMIEKLEASTVVKSRGTNARTLKREYVELEMVTRSKQIEIRKVSERWRQAGQLA